jgi:hypothetical protein
VNLAYENFIIAKKFYKDSDSCSKENQIAMIETKIRNIEQLLSKD